MDYIVIGGGVSGLSIANILQKSGNKVTVFEKEGQPGGLIRCQHVDGSLFHQTGGHVFNTKREDVLTWFWSFFSRDTQFHKANRNSIIMMDGGKEIPYPIENHLYMLDEKVGQSAIQDFINRAINPHFSADNFEDFLKKTFGQTLYELYFRPYNEKIWRKSLNDVPLSWLEGKLPMPTVQEVMFNNIFRVKENAFVHSSFFYPNRGGSQFIADTLAHGLDIRYGNMVEHLERRGQGWLVNGEEADAVIFCGNVKQLPKMLSGCISLSDYQETIEDLPSHGTTSVFCEIQENPYSWIYLPVHDYEAHRIICTGNFSPNNNGKGKMTATIEFTDYINYDEIIGQLARIPLKPRYLTHHYAEYT